jgi:hypothetical protein
MGTAPIGMMICDREAMIAAPKAGRTIEKV